MISIDQIVFVSAVPIRRWPVGETGEPRSTGLRGFWRRTWRTGLLLIKQCAGALNKIHALFNRQSIGAKREKYLSKRSLGESNLAVFL